MLKVNDWIEVIVAKTGCSKKEAKIVFDCTFDYIKEQISPDELFSYINVSALWSVKVQNPPHIT